MADRGRKPFPCGNLKPRCGSDRSFNYNHACMDTTTPMPQHENAASPPRTAPLGLLIGMTVFCLVWASTSQAEIYKFVDDNGFVTYTNMPRPGAKPQLVIPDPAQAQEKRATTSATTKRKSSTPSSTPAYFPRIDTGTQRKRDDMRRQLLEEELNSEQRNLTAAKSAVAVGSRQPGTDLNKLLDAVRLHEKNIEMLNKELSHIR